MYLSFVQLRRKPTYQQQAMQSLLECFGIPKTSQKPRQFRNVGTKKPSVDYLQALKQSHTTRVAVRNILYWKLKCYISTEPSVCLCTPFMCSSLLKCKFPNIRYILKDYNNISLHLSKNLLLKTANVSRKEIKLLNRNSKSTQT